MPEATEVDVVEAAAGAEDARFVDAAADREEVADALPDAVPVLVLFAPLT